MMFTRENVAATPGNAMVPAVAKAFRLLDLLSASAEPLGVSELARRLAMGKSTVYGLVTTLVSLGVVEAADGAKRYRLGRGLHALAMRSAGRQDVRSVARPFLEQLAARNEQTTFLGVVNGDQVTIIDLVHGRPSMSISAPVGSAIPLLAGAVGKAVLASWDEERRSRFLAQTQLPRFTAGSIVQPGDYLAVVREAAANGYALDVDEYVEGVRAAAAPVGTGAGELAAVIWVAGFGRHIDDVQLLRIAKDVAEQARAIALLL